MSATGHIIGLRYSDIAVNDGEAPNTSVYYCLVCGPIIREDWSYGSVTFHRQVPHPVDMTFDEEEVMQ